jgi:predicted HTH transcriptional regulator
MLQEKIILKKGNSYDIKNIGALLFAKNLEDFETLGRKAVRVIFYDGNSRVKAQKERLETRGYAIDFNNIIQYLDDNLPSREIIDKGLRQTIRPFPMLALRELAANAMIHQDFSISGTSPMIEVFSNRIEITNAGKPLIDPMRFIDHNPETRNELLARFMRRLNICEERGSGYDKVIIECEKFQLPVPEILAEERYTRIIIREKLQIR